MLSTIHNINFYANVKYLTECLFKRSWLSGTMVAHIKGAGLRKAKYSNFDRPKDEWATIGSYNRQLRVKFTQILDWSLTFAIPSGFGRSRIRRNCGYTLLAVVFIH